MFIQTAKIFTNKEISMKIWFGRRNILYVYVIYVNGVQKNPQYYIYYVKISGFLLNFNVFKF